MKNSVGKLLSATALAIVLLPIASVGQNISGTVGTVNRSVERVTLLPGPTLLSPARGAPQSTPGVTIVPASQLRSMAPPQWRFAPGPLQGARFMPIPSPQPTNGSMILGPAGTLTLGSYPEDAPAAAGPKNVQPNPNLFRFEEKLESPKIPLAPEAAPAAPKRQ